MQDKAAADAAAKRKMAGYFDPANCKSLYIGNLHPFVNESMLQEIFSTLGQVAEVKVIKDKVTGMSASYGFVKFTDHRSADLALQSINGRVLYGQEVRVNWAFQKDQREDTSSHYHIFVGDLSSEVNDRTLFEAFATVGSGCSDARVMWDHNTGRSKGYGFVSFRTQEEAEAAIAQMHGEFIGHRRVRCGWAQHKQSTSQQSIDYTTVDKADPNNCNVYVGNVSPEVSDAELKRAFSVYGTVLEVKSYRKGSYGFVQFQRHEQAVRAIVEMNNRPMGGKPLKCSWGRHQNRNPMPASMVMGMLGSPMMGGLMPPGMAPMMVNTEGLLAGMPQMMVPPMPAGQMPTQQMMMAAARQGAGPSSQVSGSPNQLSGIPGTASSAMGLDPNASMYYGLYYGAQ